MVKVTSLIVKAGSGLRFSFGVRAWTEMEIRCVKGMHGLKLVSCENNSGIKGLKELDVHSLSSQKLDAASGDNIFAWLIFHYIATKHSSALYASDQVLSWSKTARFTDFTKVSHIRLCSEVKNTYVLRQLDLCETVNL